MDVFIFLTDSIRIKGWDVLKRNYLISFDMGPGYTICCAILCHSEIQSAFRILTRPWHCCAS